MTGGGIGSWARQWGVPAAMLAVVLGLALSTPGFLTPQNLRNLGTQVPVNLILAAGMTLVILTGGIDLSIGSMHALCGVTAGLILTQPALAEQLGPAAVPAAVAGALLLGAILGAVNGAAIGGIGIPPFIATLAMMSIARGVAKHLTNGTALGIVGPDVPQWERINANWSGLRPLGLGYVGDAIPISFLIAVGVLLVLGVALRRTQVGRNVYAVGGNEQAARLAGIPAGRVKLLVYTLMGLLTGLTGVLETAMLQSVHPTTGEGYELNAIAAVVVGGTRLTGGQGGVVGTFLGAVFVIGLMNNALNLRGVPAFSQDVAKGAIIFGVALVDRLFRRKE